MTLSISIGLGVTQGGGVAFTPQSLSSLVAHHDPSDAASVTLNGSDVASVADKSGNSRAAAQGTAGQQPAYTVADINGKNAITYTGASNDTLVMSNALSLVRNRPGVTFVGVVKISDFTAINRLLTVMTNSGVTLLAAQVLTGQTLNISTRRISADSISGLTSTATLSSGTAAFVGYTVDYATGTVVLQIDSATRTQTAAWATGAASEDLDHSGAPNFGRNGTNLFTGIMGETATYARALTIQELSDLRTRYFKPKYGLA